MRKRLSYFVLPLCLCFSLCGCQSGQNFTFLSFSQVKTLEVFTGAVPAAAVKKIVTVPDDIKTVLYMVNRIRIKGRAEEKDLTAGGIGIYFLFYLTSGSTVVLHVLGDGKLLQMDGVTYKIAPVDLEKLWDSLPYDEIPVGEDELPTG